MIFSSVKLSYVPTEVTTNVPLESLVLPVRTATLSSPYVVKAIVGLEPTDVTAYISGSYYQGSDVANKQLIILLRFQPNYKLNQTYEDLRTQLYPWLTPKLNLPVTFSLLDSAGTEMVSILGRVTKIEPSIFSKEPEAQITIDTLSSYFSGPMLSYPDVGNLDKMPLVLNNPGDAPTPFYMKATLLASMTEFELWDTYSQRMKFVFPFNIGDEIELSTVPDKAFARYTRSNLTRNLLPYLSSNSTLLQLHAGINHLQPFNNAFSVNELNLYPKYWGA